MNNDCHPCVVGKMTDFLLPKLQWSLFTPTRCNVVHGQGETGLTPIQQKKDHLQKERFIVYSTLPVNATKDWETLCKNHT